MKSKIFLPAIIVAVLCTGMVRVICCAKRIPKAVQYNSMYPICPTVSITCIFTTV